MSADPARAGRATRTRTVAWEDISPGLAARSALSGADYLRGMIEGRYPRAPVAALVGFDIVAAADGVCRVTLSPAEYHLNPMGIVHGGVLATLLDTALGLCLNSILAAGEGHSTVTLEIKYLRPVTPETGLVTAEGRVVHRGRTLATTEARATDPAGKLLATGTSTLAIFPLPSP